MFFQVHLQVVCTDATVAAMDAAQCTGRPQWRVSSTVFGHIASDQVTAQLDGSSAMSMLQMSPHS